MCICKTTLIIIKNLNKTLNWIVINYLKFNINKTTYMLFKLLKTDFRKTSSFIQKYLKQFWKLSFFAVNFRDSQMRS